VRQFAAQNAICVSRNESMPAHQAAIGLVRFGQQDL
jgi:hypothetical protein